MTQEAIITQALHNLREQTGVSIKEAPSRTLSKHGKFVLDSRVHLKVGKQKIEFAVEVKNELRQVQLPAIIDLIQRKKKEDWLIISQYIPKPLREELKKLGINYLEASGNCFIKHEGLYLYINDQTVTPLRLPELGKLWKASGLKFLFLVLQNPELINAPYRSLAKESGTALGNIGPFIDELKKEGYVKSHQDGSLFMENKDQLQNKWVELFATVLRPKLKLGTYRFLDNEGIGDWEHVPTNHFYWGGEAAGALLTNYLKPARLAIYSNESKLTLMKELRLVPDVKGTIELLELFWSEEALKHPGQVLGSVPPLLAYAELATSLDSRNRETAEKIKELYLNNDR